MLNCIQLKVPILVTVYVKFQHKNNRHIKYYVNQAFTVLFVTLHGMNTTTDCTPYELTLL